MPYQKFRGKVSVAGSFRPLDQYLAAASALTKNRLIGIDRNHADPNDEDVIGVTLEDAVIAQRAFVASCGFRLVEADAPLAIGDHIKAGTGGRATKFTGAQFDIQTATEGEDGDFTQPSGATEVEISQAVDVEADRGRVIVVEGSDALGAAIFEEIALDSDDSSTVVEGVVEFTTVSAVYTADGAVLGAQDVTVDEIGAAGTICTLVKATSELAADIPAESQEAYCNKLDIGGPNTDVTFITIVGVNSAGVVARERCQLDGSSPSLIQTTTVWRYVDRILLGEFSDAEAGSVKSNATYDTTVRECGKVIAAAAARGDTAQVLIDPPA